MINPEMAYDIGYNQDRLTDEPYLFALDHCGREVARFPFGIPSRGPYICPDAEMEARNWCHQRGAQLNYLPSYTKFSDDRSTAIQNLFWE